MTSEPLARLCEDIVAAMTTILAAALGEGSGGESPGQKEATAGASRQEPDRSPQ
jgi:hypothetical protein